MPRSVVRDETVEFTEEMEAKYKAAFQKVGVVWKGFLLTPGLKIPAIFRIARDLPNRKPEIEITLPSPYQQRMSLELREILDIEVQEMYEEQKRLQLLKRLHRQNSADNLI